MSDNRKIDENLARMKEEMIRSIQECVQIDSVKGEPEEGAPYGPGHGKHWIMHWNWEKSWDFRL